jgi:hypothetical protein
MGPKIVHFGLLPDKVIHNKKGERIYQNYCGSD